MKTSRAAIRYAKALLSYALEHQCEAQVAQDMSAIVTQLEQQKEIALFLDNAVVPAQNKQNAVKEIFCRRPQNHPSTRGFASPKQTN